MIPVDQTIFESGKGDCLRACIASITEIQPQEIPNFSEDQSYTVGAVSFLAKRGFTNLRIDFPGDGYEHQEYISCPHYCVLMGWSPRSDSSDQRRRQHAVVARAFGWRFKIEHDPHPSRAGLIGNPFSAMWIFRSP